METTFTISNPTLKSGAILKFTSYEIKSTTSDDSSSSSKECLVQRRYSDFLWLHGTLREHNSGCIIPPLPKKQFLGRFHPLFIDNRIRGIENFLTKVLAHPVLGQELYVHTFLETHDLTQAQKIADSCQTSDNAGVINWLQTQKNVLTASESSMVKSQVLVETEIRMQPILDHMANAVKYAPKVVESSVALQKQQASMVALRQKHGEGCARLHQVDSDHAGVLTPSLLEFSSSELALASITDSHILSVNMEVLEPLQRYTSTVFALRASVTGQRNKRANHIAANSAIQRDSVRNPNHEEQVAKASRCLNEYVDASNRLDTDYNRYHQERTDDLLLLLHSLVSLQVQHCQNSQVVWTELEASLVAGTDTQPPPPLRVQSRSPDKSVWSPPPPSPSSSLLNLEESDEEEEGRESEFYESV